MSFRDKAWWRTSLVFFVCVSVSLVSVCLSLTQTCLAKRQWCSSQERITLFFTDPGETCGALSNLASYFIRHEGGTLQVKENFCPNSFVSMGLWPWTCPKPQPLIIPVPLPQIYTLLVLPPPDTQRMEPKTTGYWNSQRGAPGWLGWLSYRLWIWAQVMSSQSWGGALRWAPCSARSLLEILSPCPFPHMHPPK